MATVTIANGEGVQHQVTATARLTNSQRLLYIATQNPNVSHGVWIITIVRPSAVLLAEKANGHRPHI